ESFRQACRRFIYTENLLPEAPAPDRAAAPEAKSLQGPADAVALLRKAIAKLDDDEDGWVELGAVGRVLSNLAPDFDPRTYGFGRLGDLVGHTDAFEVERMEGRGLRIRATPEKKQRAPRRTKA